MVALSSPHAPRPLSPGLAPAALPMKTTVFRNEFAAWCKEKMFRVMLSNTDLWRAVHFLRLYYLISTKAFLFSGLTAPFPLALAGSAECLKLLWVDTSPHLQEKEPLWQGTSPGGAGWGRRMDLLRTLHSMLAKITLYSLLPDCLKMFTF